MEPQSPTANPLNQIRAEHIMISTDDLDATITWYQNVLGFTVARAWTVPELPGVKLAYIERNGFVIEIVETPDRIQPMPRPADLGASLRRPGIGHLAFLVADVDTAAAELRKHDVDFLLEPTSFPDAGRRLIFIFDNNGNILEFLTPLDPYEQEAGHDE